MIQLAKVLSNMEGGGLAHMKIPLGGCTPIYPYKYRYIYTYVYSAWYPL